jgi:hypothetical protein
MKRLLLPLVLALAGAAVSFLIARALIGDEPDPTDFPDDAVAVVIPFQVAEGEDAWEAAIVEAAALGAQRDAASRVGVVIEDSAFGVDPDAGAGYAFPDLFEWEWGESFLFGDSETPPVEEGSADSPSPAEDDAADRAVDGCAAGEPPADCPDGVAGTILAIRSLPPLAAILKPDPFAPGTAPFNFWPECPVVEPSLGRVSVGAATNRPSDVTITWWAYSPYRSRPVDGLATASVSSGAAQEAAWTAWAGDESAGYDDPRYWIDHCFVLEGLDPGTYAIETAVVDRLASGDLYRTHPVQFFTVPDEHGEVPVQRRRPTVLVPYGLERVFVGVTRQPEHRVVVRAFEYTRGASCDTGGDPASVVRPAPGVIDGVLTAESEIPRERLTAPEYPYLPTHSRDTAFVLDLEVGTDYLVCLYWVVGEGLAIDLVEGIRVTTPDAYRPIVRLEGLTELFVRGTPVSIRVNAPGCGGATVDLASVAVTDGRTEGLRIPLCAFPSGVSTVDARHGFAVTSSLTFDGRPYERRVFVRTGRLACTTAPCLLRLDDVVLVPLPEVATERRLCGSGWGSGCSGEVPTRTAGYAALRIVYDRGRSAGNSTWMVGTPDEFRDTVPETPRLSATVSFESGVRFGRSALVEVRSDRPVSLAVSTIDRGEASGVSACATGDGPVDYVSDMPSTRHAFRLSGLCAGHPYALVFSGEDSDGNEAVVVARAFTWTGLPATPTLLHEPTTILGFFAPSAYLVLETSVQVIVPDEPVRFTVVIDGGLVRAPTLEAIGAGSGGYLLDRPVVLESYDDWTHLSGGAACSGPMPGPFRVTGRGYAIVAQRDTEIAIGVSVYRNRPRGGGIVGDCVRGDVVASYLLRAAGLSVDDLFRGVTLTSDDGRVVVTVRATMVP